MQKLTLESHDADENGKGFNNTKKWQDLHSRCLLQRCQQLWSLPILSVLFTAIGEHLLWLDSNKPSMLSKFMLSPQAGSDEDKVEEFSDEF